MLFLTTLLLLGTAVLGQLPVQQFPNGSQIIAPNQLPYQAKIYLHWGNGSDSLHAERDAVLISPEWLLTAKSCLDAGQVENLDRLDQPIEVLLGCDKVPGAFDLNNRKKLCEAGVKRRVVRHFLGPRVQIGDRTQDSDLLLLKLDKAVPTSANITPIELPEVGTSWAFNQTAVVSGFGELPGDDLVGLGLPRTLQYTKLLILNKRDCLAMLRKKLPVRVSSYKRPFPRIMSYEKLRLKVAPETILCAEFKERGYLGCLGHSGGPLAVCATPLQTSGGQQLCEGNRWQLAGFFSGSFRKLNDPEVKCLSKPEFPALFTNVAPFADWIRRTINNN